MEEMRFLAALLLPGLTLAALLPDTIGPYQRTSNSAPVLKDKQLWDEYGLKESETAAYAGGSDRFTLTAYRLQDSTSAMAAFQWQRPAASQPSQAAPLAAATPDSLLLVHGNYLLAFAGHKPSAAELETLYQDLKNVDSTILPVLPSYLPAAGLVPNSERYILGPDALAKFDPAIPPSVAAFRFGTEAQLGVFHSPKGDFTVAIFNYPTHLIAIERLAEFQKLPGAMVKRTGPFVAVTLSPPDPDAAERLLAGIRYQAEVTRDEYVPTHRDNIGWLVLSIFVLIGILLAFSVVSGLAVGLVRTWIFGRRTGVDAEPMIRLHLEER
jgi:hypothetical protein